MQWGQTGHTFTPQSHLDTSKNIKTFRIRYFIAEYPNMIFCYLSGYIWVWNRTGNLGKRVPVLKTLFTSIRRRTLDVPLKMRMPPLLSSNTLGSKRVFVRSKDESELDLFKRRHTRERKTTFLYFTFVENKYLPIYPFGSPTGIIGWKSYTESGPFC